MLEYTVIDKLTSTDIDYVNKMKNEGWRLISICPTNEKSFSYWFERNKISKNTYIGQNNGNLYVN